MRGRDGDGVDVGDAVQRVDREPIGVDREWGRLEARIGPQHQQMIEQVGGFLGQLPLIAGHRLDHRLDRLLAQFLRDLGPPAKEQLGGIGGFRIGAAPVEDRLVQPVERLGIRRHAATSFMGGASRTGMPDAASRALAWAMVKMPKWKIEAARTAEAWP